MKKEISKSRTLRRKLLLTLLLCLAAVMGICTAIFRIVFQQASDTVKAHAPKITSTAVSVVSEAIYQQRLASLQDQLYAFAQNVSMLLPGLDEAPELTEEELEQRIAGNAEMYFQLSETDPLNVFFFCTDGEIRSIFPDTEPGSTIIRNALAAFDLNIRQNPEFYGADTTFLSWMDQVSQETTGSGSSYSRENEGYLIAWDNLYNYAPYNLCFGMIQSHQNLVVNAMDNAANEKSELLIQDMNTLFTKYFWILLAAVSGVLLVFIAVSVVISKRLAAPVVSEHDMLVQVNEMKTTFLSDVSHELKTPLAAMSGYAQNAEMDLVNGESQQQIQEKLRRISSEANRMALTVTQILDATRIEEGRMVLDKAPCDLDSLVRETVETYFSVLNKNHNRLIIRIPLDLPQIDADKSRLQRVFVNLISNALRHTDHGTILIKAEAAERNITVTVKDTGSGIGPEDLPHIWERYYKGKQSETGTGLGLFICKFIVESHGGTISVESEPGKGTTFTIVLPQ